MGIRVECRQKCYKAEEKQNQTGIYGGIHLIAYQNNWQLLREEKERFPKSCSRKQMPMPQVTSARVTWIKVLKCLQQACKKNQQQNPTKKSLN